MSGPGARLTAAALRSIGIDAQPSPDSDVQTLELGGLPAQPESPANAPALEGERGEGQGSHN